MEKELCHDDALRLLLCSFYDPWFNLAVEECIFPPDARHPTRAVLWRNADGGHGRVESVERVYPGVWKRGQRPSGAPQQPAVVRYSTIWAIPALPLWRVSRNTTKTISTSIVLNNALNLLGVTAEALLGHVAICGSKRQTEIAKCQASRPIAKHWIAASTTAPFFLNADLSRLANYLNPDKKNCRPKDHFRAGGVANWLRATAGHHSRANLQAIRGSLLCPLR